MRTGKNNQKCSVLLPVYLDRGSKGNTSFLKVRQIFCIFLSIRNYYMLLRPDDRVAVGDIKFSEGKFMKRGGFRMA